MPQVDKVTLMPQVFWLVLLFLGVYFYLSKKWLKPLLFFIKFKLSFLSMKLQFYTKLFVGQAQAYGLTSLTKHFFELQKNVLTYLSQLSRLILLTLPFTAVFGNKNFISTFLLSLHSFLFQYETSSKTNL